MRVAVVATSPYRGGAEEYIYRLYGRLKTDHGVTPTLIGNLPDWPPSLGEEILTPCSQKLTRQKPLPAQALRSCCAAYRIATIVRAGKFDLMHIQYFEPKLLLPKVICRHTPVLWTEHGPLPSNLPSGGRQLLRMQARSSRVVAVSDSVEQSLRSAGIRSEVIWNPLPRLIASISTRVNRTRRRVMFAGRLHRTKRVDLLVKAAELVPDTDVVIVGEGPDLQRLRSIAGLNVQFLGRMPSVVEELRRCDAVVVCSGREAREGSPLIALEARQLAVRLLVARDCHASSEAIQLGGVLFDPTPERLASAVEEIPVGAPFPLDDAMLFARSEDRWAASHYAIMSAIA